MDRPLRLALAMLLLITGAFAVTAIACGDDDDDGSVEVINGASPEADPDPEADPEAAAEDITPGPKPDAATQVSVTLGEWSIATNAASVPAGAVYFLVQNAGPDHPHEFVVIKSDLAPNALPVEDGKVPEDDVDLLGEIEPFGVGSTGSLTLDLEPGSYLLICNIVEEEHADEGDEHAAAESHYELGMRTTLTVE